MTVTLYHGDCLEILPTLDAGSVDAVVTDPPYGCNNDCDYTRFSGGLSDSRNYTNGIRGDDRPFDPAPWLTFPNVILWGYQFYADRLPQGTVLVWLKKRDNQLGSFLSDCEIAWQKGGKGVYLMRHVWHGFDRQSEREASVHPTQKPVAVMRWCIDRSTRPGDTILDPFMGSGTTGVACVQTGRNFIGIEIDRAYYEIAERRIAEAQLQPRLFTEEESEPDAPPMEQLSLYAEGK
jgi:site-specific DNA-methyltransferase (adenine-specific)